MKTPESCDHAVKIAETVTVLCVDDALPPALQTGLGYAAAPYWVSGDKLYILNCALADTAVLCACACKTEFLWGRAGEPLGRYKSLRGEAVFVEIAAGVELPADYMNHALPVFSTQELRMALEEKRTFMSRGRHRRAAGLCSNN